MNDKAIKKWFWGAWKYRVFIARTKDGRLWLSDINCLILIKDNDPVLESRKVFPRIPENGQSFQESKDDRFNRDGKGPDIEGLIERTLKDDNKPLKLTEWFKYSYPCYVRMLETQDNKKIFVNTYFLDLLDPSYEKLSEYQFLGTDPDKVILVKKKDELIALLMPIRNHEESR